MFHVSLDMNQVHPAFRGATPAEAAGKMAFWLLENGHMKRVDND